MSISTTGTVTWTPAVGTDGVYNVTVNVADGGENGTTTQSQNLQVTVSQANTVPTIDAIATQSATEDSLFNYQVTVTDNDGANTDNLTYSLTTAPAGMSINASTGLISWTPSSETDTAASVTVQIVDADAVTGFTTDSTSFNINITLVNESPVLAALPNQAVAELATLSFNAGAYVSDVDDVNDGSGLIWSLSGAPAGMTISNTGLVEWTPNVGTGGGYNITVQVIDGGEDGSSLQAQNLFVAVGQINIVPELDAIATQAAVEDQPFNLTATYTDVDGANSDSVTYSLTTSPAGMTINASTGAISWTPTSETETSTSVSVQIVDADATTGFTTDSTSFTINITLVNEAPVLTALANQAVTELQTLSYNAGANVSDVDDVNDGTGLTWTLIGAPAGVTVSNTGTVSWTPNVGEAGVYNFGVQVADGGEDGALPQAQNLQVTVNQTNTVPAINPIADQSATEDSAFNYSVTVTDLDGANSDSLTYSLTSSPAGMTINAATGAISWTPTSETDTSASVTVQVVDADAVAGYTTDSTSFNINITLVNEAPQLAALPAQTLTELDDLSVDLGALVSDVDDTNNGTDLTWSLSNAPTGMTISNLGVVSWTTTVGDANTYNVTVQVADGGEDSAAAASQSLSVTVDQANTVPSIDTVADQAATEDSEFTLALSVTDNDGANSDSLTYSLTAAPTGMTINASTGEITWTPTSETDTSASVTVQIVDADAAPDYTTDSLSFNINITLVNDAPELAALPEQSISELDSLTFDASSFATDPDDVNDGTELTWSLTGAPDGMTISNLGIISWTAPENSLGTYTPTVNLADGGEDSAAVASQTLSVVVAILDGDGDTVPDYSDNCPVTANTDQADLDNDDIGDVCDNDIDGDGIDNDVEEANGLDPRDPADGTADADGDGLTNFEEYQLCLANNDAECLDINRDNNPPDIFLENIVVPATGYVTPVEFDVTAEDFKDGPVPVTADDSGPFRPGRHIITWTAVDTSDNQETAEQQLDVLPLVTLAGSAVIGEGQTYNISITLNGDAPEYPVNIDYTVSGTADANDHDLLAGTLIIDSGTSAELVINSMTDSALEGDETVIITLTGTSTNSVLSDNVSFTLAITEDNVAPVVSLVTAQGNLNSTNVTQDNGMVTVTANAFDGNGDNLTFDWTGSDPALNANSQMNQLSFDPAGIATGSYQVTVEVSDGTLSNSSSVTLNVSASAPNLSSFVDSDGDGISDADEGLNDTDGDGLPDYLDAVDDPTLLHTEVVVGADNFSNLMQSEAGLQLKIGASAKAANRTGALMSPLELVDANNNVIEDPGVDNFGGLFDFEIHGLSSLQPSATVVIPLTQFIPEEGAIYRKFIDGAWTDFVLTGLDNVASAEKVDGLCPAPFDVAYVSGIAKYANCIQLTLSDGGPNDADGQVNGVIVDPSGVAVVNTSNQEPPPPPKPTSSSGGSGQIPWPLLLMLTLLGLVRIHQKREQ